jgi:hypothetical protein
MQWHGIPSSWVFLAIQTQSLEDAEELMARNGVAPETWFQTKSIANGTCTGAVIVQESLWKARLRPLILSHSWEDRHPPSPPQPPQTPILPMVHPLLLSVWQLFVTPTFTLAIFVPQLLLTVSISSSNLLLE